MRMTEEVDRPAMLARLHEGLLDADTAGFSDLLRAALAPGSAPGPDVMTDLGAAQSFALAVLPGFWVTSGLCYLSGHASLGPDYNGPDGERLREEWPIGRGDSGWHEDLHPGEGVADVGHQCAAILRCMVKALAWRQGLDLDDAPAAPAP